MLNLHSTSPLGRRGTLTTAHGIIQTPFFMPVGTGGAMRGLTFDQLEQLGAEILLCNTYHLHLQPGETVVEAAGGLHSFTGWSKPILTDSGGFQVFSMADRRVITDSGVDFRSHITGDPLTLDPERAMRIQHALGADIIMCFDQCPPSKAPRSEVEQAVDRTLRWAEQCKKWHQQLLKEKCTTGTKGTDGTEIRKQNTSVPSVPLATSVPLLFGIVQGGLEADLRKKCAEELVAIGFDGYAVGGLAVGETPAEMIDVLDLICPLLPADKPRYLMGVGVREQLRNCVAKGIDMFDCVLPMRLGRHGTILLSDGSEIHIENSQYRHAHEPIDPASPSPLSQLHLRSYLHHLFRAKERYAETIACMQNVGVTLKLMRELQEAMDRY